MKTIRFIVLALPSQEVHALHKLTVAWLTTLEESDIEELFIPSGLSEGVERLTCATNPHLHAPDCASSTRGSRRATLSVRQDELEQEPAVRVLRQSYRCSNSLSLDRASYFSLMRTEVGGGRKVQTCRGRPGLVIGMCAPNAGARASWSRRRSK